jgi:uncharacterized protein YrrD
MEAGMWQHAKDLLRQTVSGPNEDLGHVEDLYFDDQQWVLRYFVVNTGKWLTGRLVLVSPVAVNGVDREHAAIATSLTRDKVAESPSFDAHMPLSRQYESAYAAYYGYGEYWSGPSLWGTTSFPGALAGLSTLERRAAEQAVVPSGEDAHLRSVREVIGYALAATDGPIGHVHDFVVNVETWAIRLIIVDTSTWWAGRKVLLAPKWIREIQWADRLVCVDVSREAVRSSPEWDKRAPVDEQFERMLANHYFPDAALTSTLGEPDP